MSFWDDSLDLELGQLKYRVTLMLRRHHSMVWLDGLPLTPRRAARQINSVIRRRENQMVRCWPVEPREIESCPLLDIRPTSRSEINSDATDGPA